MKVRIAAKASSTCASECGLPGTRHASGTTPGNHGPSPCHRACQCPTPRSDTCNQGNLGVRSAKSREHSVNWRELPGTPVPTAHTADQHEAAPGSLGPREHGSPRGQRHQSGSPARLPVYLHQKSHCRPGALRHPRATTWPCRGCADPGVHRAGQRGPPGHRLPGRHPRHPRPASDLTLQALAGGG